MPFTALASIFAPGTIVAGYRRGDLVPDPVVENWNLTDGVEVTSKVTDTADLPQSAPARPDEGANRASWESYAIANGMTPEDAEAATQEDLEGSGPEAHPEERADRPSDSAKKAEWVAYAKSQGADEAWADADSTTKADLQAYEPAAGDTVAVAATEANQA